MAQLKDLLVNGDASFLSDVILDHNPTAALHAVTKQYVDNNFPKITTVAGTSGAEGTATITLGNSTASGTAGNATGVVQLYDYSGMSASVRPRAISTHSVSTTLYLPDWGANTSEYMVTCTSSSGMGNSSTPVYVDANGHVQTCSGGGTVPTITLNGSTTTTPSFYAPTTPGTSGYVLTSNGSGEPSWAAASGGSSDVLNIVSGTTTYGDIIDAYTAGKVIQYRPSGTETDSGRVFYLQQYNIVISGTNIMGTVSVATLGSISYGSPAVTTAGYIDLFWTLSGTRDSTISASSATRTVVPLVNLDNVQY